MGNTQQPEAPPARSFGRRTDRPEADPVVLVPPIRLAPVTVPVVLEVDTDSLARAGDLIRQMVTTAIASGFAEALQSVEETLAEGFSEVNSEQAEAENAAGARTS